ncbi:MAG: hypothetical protein A3B89_02985 [Candidatus Buchananbacteria bacterium RIFCSPHIGHO2_02_FULL_40_13]|uniref:Radical SAM core domain-containing protein n=1 Tax=Candidatus Buchananbacteria bacterium RIFCSPLOWO2_01_FULL_39_33 TaxID=1797543 RepID=A0A1G1YFZ8_9BACT|nr:MAG: hypothetical protein A3B89_02985 [Candidatus Buchananbacteria bacterium RIFCSPHIGHO2_02_FULL_40_13]OGY51278.1 MAG: hypothetical protein A3A02_01555 [Candidatus Buchananbacteria bacterium RIFCSPLOWO2_01_FULL_39_33]
MSRLAKTIEYLIYLFVFLLPLATAWILAEKFIFGFKWQEGTFLLYATEILLWVIIILQVFLMFFKKRSADIHCQKSLVVLAIWSLVAYTGLSIFWSTNHTLSFYWWLKLLEGVILMFIVLKARFKIELVAWSLFWAGVFQSILAFWQFLSQEVISNKWLGLASHLSANVNSSVIETGGERWLRAYGGLPHPNILGGFLVISFLAGLYLYFNSFGNRRKLLSAVGLVFIVAGLFFSFSRSAWLSAIILYFIWSLILFSKKRLADLIKVSLYLLLILASLIMTYQPLVFTRLAANQRLEEKSIEQRLDSLAEARAVILKNPFFGVGLGNYTNYLISFKPGFLGWHYQPAHNIYLMVLAELGISGFLFFIIIIILVFYKSSNLLAFSAFLAWLIIGLFDHYLWTNYFGLMLFWLIIGLALKDFSKEGLGEKIIGKILLELSYFTGRNFYRSDYVSLITTWRCNLKCRTCDIWKKTEFDEEMGILNWLIISGQLKAYLSSKSFIEINGGEALIKKNLTIALISDLKKHFKTVALNTNGFLITPAVIQELEKTGLDQLKVSWYSLEADSHNFIRGSEMAFKNAAQAVALVAQSKIKLEVGILVTSYNVNQIPSLVDYLYNLGGVAIIIQPLDEIIESAWSKDMAKNEIVLDLWPTAAKSKELFTWLKNNSFKLKNSPANLAVLADYYLKPQSVLKYRCFAGQRNLVVYPTGDISFCFKRRFIGNVKKEKLKEIMQRSAVLERRGIRDCSKYCRLIGCNFSRGLWEIVRRQ